MEGPPSYVEASTTNPRATIHIAKLLSLTIDKTLIFPSAPPSVALYELNGTTVHKLHHKLTSANGEGGVRHSRTEVLYQVIPSRIPHYLYIGGRTELMLFGKGSRRTTFESATMVPGWSAGSWKIPGFFRTKCGLLGRNVEGAEIQWLDWNSGKLVALETRTGKDEGSDGEHRLPRLELKIDLEEKKRDLLVACWVARLSREAA